MFINGKVSKDVLHHQTRSNGAIIDRKNRNGYGFRTPRQRMTSSETLGNARIGTSAINEGESMNRLATRKGKGDIDEEM
jgi:hypothetical protein